MSGINYFERAFWIGTDLEMAACTPLEGAYWISTNTDELYCYYSGAWHLMTGGGGGGCFVCDVTNSYGGDGAFVSHTTAHDCTAVGYNALTNDISGNYCVAVGSGCLATNTTARGNIAIGVDACALITERDNIGIGLEALYNADNTYNNIGIGTDALWSLLHGPNNSKQGENIALGSCALFDLVYGIDNIGICQQFSFYYGEQCVFIGVEAGDSTECGSYNVGVGSFACTGAAGDGNTGIGENALSLYTYDVGGNWIDEFFDYSGTVPGTVRANSSDPWGFSLAPGVYTNMRIMGAYHYNGNYTITVIDAQNFYFTHAWAGDDCAAGYWMALLNYALYANNNTAIGHDAGYLNESNSECTYVGYNANPDNLGIYVNSMALGANAEFTKSNQVVIGDTNIVENLLHGSVLIGTTTDGMTAGGSLAIAQDLAHRGTLVGLFNIAPAIQSVGWTISNLTPDKILDCDATTLAELADVVGTLIEAMKLNGYIGA